MNKVLKRSEVESRIITRIKQLPNETMVNIYNLLFDGFHRNLESRMYKEIEEKIKSLPNIGLQALYNTLFISKIDLCSNNEYSERARTKLTRM